MAKRILIILLATGVLFLFYTTLAFLLLYNYPPQKYGWNPYIFGGMPEFATGVSGVKYYNFIWLVVAFADILFSNLICFNPFTYLFIGLMVLVYFRVKKVWLSIFLYILLIELTILFLVVK